MSAPRVRIDVDVRCEHLAAEIGGAYDERCRFRPPPGAGAITLILARRWAKGHALHTGHSVLVTQTRTEVYE